MFDCSICMVAAFLAVTGIAYYFLIMKKKQQSTVPGLQPSDPETGNLVDLGEAGSLHQFLVNLHNEFGEIASFWFGKQFVVSISSAKLFKQHSRLFDRPPVMFQLFEPLITKDSIQFANGEDGRKRRQMYDQCYTHSALPQYFTTIQQAADETCQHLSAVPSDEHIPLMQNMFSTAIKVMLRTSFGSYFNNEDEVLAIEKAYDVCWSEMEHRLDGNVPRDDDPRMKTFNENKEKLFAIMKSALENRKNNPPKGGEQLLIDVLLDSDQSEDIIAADGLTYLIGGFHTSGLLMTWAIYYMTKHPEVQEKIKQELNDVLGDNEITPANIADLIYLYQVLDETLRCSVLAPYAARYSDDVMEIGGHVIPAQTPVVHSLGVSLHDKSTWPDQHRFDPDRFRAENKKNRSNFAFMPFGFAGQRQCPGNKFAYVESVIVLGTLLRKMTLKLVDGQEVKPEHGLVTKPSEEIWITCVKTD